MRVRSLVSAAALACVSLLAHADTVSVYDLQTQDGSGAIGTLTIDTTTGTITDMNVSMMIDYAAVVFSGAPVSQAFSPYTNEYTARFNGSTDEFLLGLPVNTLVGYTPGDNGKCTTQAVYCDYLTNIYAGPVSSANLFATLEGNLTLVSTTTSTVTPEPSSFALLGTGLLGLAGFWRRRLARARLGQLGQ